eukprot:CAMPEP_0119299564 /NCGR_PEP_ID=MMETSP1333-20130426/1638_1 /TAXON_ID=418940 /ORGANISM="Scyphosphaera apsteinii, Strain RCC1455" /LENGTH=95 /DNA_ID=CAMNT_0007301031 /DNA_START=27 /DNA_END=314 /DNA_ORIENTATION=+
MMHRTLLMLTVLFCVGSCYVQPGVPLKVMSKAPVTPRAVAPDMVVDEMAQAATLVNTIGTAVASSAGDFGGYTIPIIGLGVLAATISLLAGPVED